MKSVRLLAALCAALLLTACSSDLLPPSGVAGSWSSRVTYDSGPSERSVYNKLVLGSDGRFVWVEAMYGDGAGRTDLPGPVHVRFGRYRLREPFLEIRTEATEYSAVPTDTPVRTRVRRPEWSGRRYRIDVDDEQLTLRFTVAPADAPEDVTLVFEREVQSD